MTILQYPDALSFSGNLKKFVISAIAPILFSLKMGETTILANSYSPGVGGLIEIDLREIVDRLLSIEIPTTGASELDQTSGFADFTAYIDVTPVTFRAIKGGVSGLQELASNFVDDHFLTWQIQEKYTLQSQPEWLTLYPTAIRVVKATAYFSTGGGTGNSSQTLTLATVPAGNMISLNVSWSALHALLAEQNHIAWDVWFEDVSGTRLSYIQRYRLRNATAEENLFLWVNTLGGVDSVSFTGYSEHDRKLDHIISELYDDSLEEYDTNIKAEIKQSTGYITLKESRWIEDLFYSRKRYKVDADGSVKPIVIVSSKIVDSTADDIFDYEFSYRYSVDDLLLNLDRTLDDLPAPEGLSAFFLTELLSSLTTALYQGNLNLAVQSPFVQGWQRISFNELWESALPTLVDGLTVLYSNGKLRTNAGAISDGLKPKHGFENVLESELSFQDPARLFTITNLTLMGKIRVWNMGNLLSKTTETISIQPTNGIWYIYYKDVVQEDLSVVSTLTSSMDPWNRNVDIPIATVTWDGSVGTLKDYRYFYTEINHTPLVRFEDKPHPAEDIYTSTSEFKNLFSEEETTVQKVLDKLDYYLKVGKIAFTETAEPAIENYQDDQEDPQDATKIINYQKQFGSDPHLRLVITEDGNEKPWYQAPIIYKTAGVITRIAWYLGEMPFTGKILISRL